MNQLKFEFFLKIIIQVNLTKELLPFSHGLFDNLIFTRDRCDYEYNYTKVMMIICRKLEMFLVCFNLHTLY